MAEDLLALKKRILPLIGEAKMSLAICEKAEREIMWLKAWTELPPPVLLSFAGIPERTWREWQERRGEETKHNNNVPRSYYLTPEESAAIVDYCRAQCGEHPEKGYRTLCWEMVDKKHRLRGRKQRVYRHKSP